MKDDVISRQAAIDIIEFECGKWIGLARTIVKAIKQLPSAQPERKKGMWIHDGRDFPHGVDWIHCSVCGKKGINAPADLTNFCPNCGADMREGQDEYSN